MHIDNTFQQGGVIVFYIPFIDQEGDLVRKAVVVIIPGQIWGNPADLV